MAAFGKWDVNRKDVTTSSPGTQTLYMCGPLLSPNPTPGWRLWSTEEPQNAIGLGLQMIMWNSSLENTDLPRCTHTNTHQCCQHNNPSSLFLFMSLKHLGYLYRRPYSCLQIVLFFFFWVYGENVLSLFLEVSCGHVNFFGQWHESRKDNPQNGRKKCKWCDRQGIDLQNLQTAHVAQYQKNKQPNQKMGRKPKLTLLQRRHTDGQEAHEKMFNSANY